MSQENIHQIETDQTIDNFQLSNSINIFDESNWQFPDQFERSNIFLFININNYRWKSIYSP